MSPDLNVLLATNFEGFGDAHEQLIDMPIFNEDGLEFDGIEFDVNNNHELDVFGNSDFGGSGSLSYAQPEPSNNHSQESFPAPVVDGPSPFHNSDQEQSSSVMLSSERDEHLAGSVENAIAAHDKEAAGKYEEKPAFGLLKDEEPVFDNGDGNHDDEGGEDGEDEKTPGTKKKRKPYSETRHLTRWSVGKDQLVLLVLQYECHRRGIELPWEAVIKHINPEGTGDSLWQHLVKVRRARVYYGLPVPPPILVKSTNKKAQPEDEKEAEDIHKQKRTFLTLTTKLHADDDYLSGEPGEMAENVTINPSLTTGGSLSLKPSAKHQRKDAAPSSDKKGKSTGAVKVEQDEEEDADYEVKPIKKTPASSKKKQTATQKTPSKASPAKPQGIVKSKKPSSKLAQPLAIRTSDLEESASVKSVKTGAPVKKTASAEKKAKAAAPSSTPGRQATESLAQGSPAHEATDNVEVENQSYGRTDVPALSVPAESQATIFRSASENFLPSFTEVNQNFNQHAPMQNMQNMQHMQNMQNMQNMQGIQGPMHSNDLQPVYMSNNVGYGNSFHHGQSMQSMQDMQNMQNMQGYQMGMNPNLVQTMHVPHGFPPAINQSYISHGTPAFNQLMPMQGHAQPQNQSSYGMGLINSPPAFYEDVIPPVGIHVDTHTGEYITSGGPAPTQSPQQSFDSNSQSIAHSDDHKIDVAQFEGNSLSFEGTFNNNAPFAQN